MYPLIFFSFSIGSFILLKFFFNLLSEVANDIISLLATIVPPVLCADIPTPNEFTLALSAACISPATLGGEVPIPNELT
jgi:hypothetical protein